jgi:SAM-dependent methyltransferase
MNKERFYNTIAEEFDSLVYPYDTRRRLEVIYDDFLGNFDLKGKCILDGGCGSGWFTKKGIERGAKVISLDIAENLVKVTKRKTSTACGVVGSLLHLPFNDDSFDLVVSSDVIEHTDDPLRSTEELIRVTKEGGFLCITVPNRSFWYFSVVVANKLRIRPYRGNENWVHYRAYERYLSRQGCEILSYKGIHLFPFVVPWLNPILARLDKIAEEKWGPIMVNIAAFMKKRVTEKRK